MALYASLGLVGFQCREHFLQYVFWITLYKQKTVDWDLDEKIQPVVLQNSIFSEKAGWKRGHMKKKFESERKRRKKFSQGNESRWTKSRQHQKLSANDSCDRIAKEACDFFPKGLSCYISVHKRTERNLSQNPTIYKKGAKVLSARLAKVPNLLTTTLTRCLCNAREHVAIWGDYAENNHEKTADVKGIYPNFKQKLALKRKFCHFKNPAKASRVWKKSSQSSKVTKNDN